MKQNEIRDIITLSNYPEWRAANDKLNDLMATEKGLKDEVNQLLSTSLTDKNKRRDIYSEQAQAMLDGKKPEMDTSTIQADIETARHKLLVVTKAIEMQKHLVHKAHADASAKANKKIEPEYKRRIDKVARAMLVLERAASEERDLRASITAGGLSLLMRPMACNFLGYINAEYGDANILRWLKEADEYGLIDKKKMLKFTTSKEWVAKQETYKKPDKPVLSVPMDFIRALRPRANKTQQATKRLVERRLYQHWIYCPVGIVINGVVIHPMIS